MTDVVRNEKTPGPSSATPPPASGRRHPVRRTALLALAGAVLLGALVTVSVANGDLPLPPADAVKGLFGLGDSATVLVVQQFRAPRMVAAIVAGAGLAVAGALLQRLFRNPLASPM